MTQPAVGALFDWDGVIIDSAPQHEQSWERLAQEIGKPLARESFVRGFGMKNERIIPEILHWSDDAAEIRRLSLRKEELYREIVQETGMTPLPGVKTFLDRLKLAGIPRIVASSTHRLNIDTILGVLGLTGAFDDIVSSEDVTQGKPHPEVFLKAGARIGMAPNRCVVFEDAHVGIAAAHAAGMRVVAVTTTHPARELTAADRVVRQLDEVTLDDLDALVQERQ